MGSAAQSWRPLQRCPMARCDLCPRHAAAALPATRPPAAHSLLLPAHITSMRIAVEAYHAQYSQIRTVQQGRQPAMSMQPHPGGLPASGLRSRLRFLEAARLLLRPPLELSHLREDHSDIAGGRCRGSAMYCAGGGTPILHWSHKNDCWGARVSAHLLLLEPQARSCSLEFLLHVRRKQRPQGSATANAGPCSSGRHRRCRAWSGIGTLALDPLHPAAQHRIRALLRHQPAKTGCMA